MTKQRLQVFARIKPCSYQNQTLSLTLNNNNKIILQTSRNKLSSAKQHHQYSFEKVFQENTDQEQIFEHVAKPVINNCLQGYNGTIFAYGQTGSGKTFTMSGGDDWEQRGIIPRVLSYIFTQFEKYKHQVHYEMGVSYVQIYNENAYDLLSENNSDNNFQQWPKITLMQDEEKGIVFRNGSNNICKTSEEALDYFMMGNYLRKVSCTNMNQVSSRSHCIFILNIKGVDLATSTEIYSKINLVDLAGSERVSKSHAEGIVLTQAKAINLSLSYLEQVIVSLNEKVKSKTKVHIPYRNSLLTSLLKDSLGGNCKTVMIATVSSQNDNQQQTVSTLRFSQRVRQIKNEICKNEKNSLVTKIEMLERENAKLKKKLEANQKEKKQAIIQSSQLVNLKQIEKKVQDFMNQKIASISVENLSSVNLYFVKMKDIYHQKMKEYVSQLTFISQKIIQYDRMLDERQKRVILKDKNYYY